MVKKTKPQTVKSEETDENTNLNKENSKTVIKQVVEVIDLEKTVITEGPLVLDDEIKSLNENQPLNTPTEEEDSEFSDNKTDLEEVNSTESLEENELQEKAENNDYDDDEVKKEDQDDKPRSKQVVEELFTKNTAEIPIQKQAAKKPIIWAITVMVAALVTGAGLIFFSTKATPGQSVKPAITPEPTSTIEIVATPTPAPVVDKGIIQIEVLNGGGVKGAAGKMKTFLEDKGYQVKSTGNTEEYTFENTEISVKKSQEEILTLLRNDLANTYKIGSADTNLPDSSEFDVVITVGKE